MSRTTSRRTTSRTRTRPPTASRRRQTAPQEPSFPIQRLAVLFVMCILLAILVALVIILIHQPWLLLFPMLLGCVLIALRYHHSQRLAWLEAEAQLQERYEQEQRRQEAVHYQHLLAQDLGRWLRLSASEFEALFASLLAAVGYQEVRCTGGAGDRGCDIHAVSPRGEVVIVQCKRYAPGNPVGSTTLQSFGGAIRRFRAHRGIFVTTSGFTSEARGIAEQDGNIELIDGDQLVALFAQVVKRQQ